MTGSQQVDAALPAGSSITPISIGRRRYMLGVLLLVYICNFVDRQVLTILAEPIRAELNLQDWHIGVLTGFGFVLVYVVLGFPFAMLADRFRRPVVLGSGITIWSAFTMLSGLAASFPMLLLCRVGVGIGEAGCSPTAHSLISDCTPPAKRGSALAIFALGNPIGLLVGMALGGLIAQHYGWRTAFFVAGAPGFLLALLVFLTLPEPRKRGIRRTAAVADGPRETVWRKPSFWLMSCGVGVTTFLFAGTVAFVTPFLLRSQSAEVADLAHRAGAAMGVELQPLGFLGLALGLTLGLGGGLGTWLGGYLVDRFGTGSAARYMAVPAAAAAVAPIFFLLAWTSQSPLVTIILIGLGTLSASIASAPVYAGVQSVTPASARAIAAAMMLFLLNLIGGFGPLVVGILSDWFGGGVSSGEGLRLSLSWITLSGVIAVALFVLAGRYLENDRVRALDHG